MNEVKRDNEVMRQITSFQLSIENLVRSLFKCLLFVFALFLVFVFFCKIISSTFQTQSLALYGRPKIDGELKICSPEKKSKQDRCVLSSLQ